MSTNLYCFLLVTVQSIGAVIKLVVESLLKHIKKKAEL